MTSALDLLMYSDSAAETTTLLESNGICTIDSRTRTIFVPPEIVVGAVQSDKNAERIKFSCPKIVGDNLDLSKFSIRINFENVSSVDPDISIKDQYICEDASINGDNITFSWVIGKNAARYMGTIRFIVCAVKTDSDSNISIEWNTTVAQIPVLEGIEVDQPSLDENNKDIINQLLAITKTASDEAVKNVNSAKEQAITDIQNVLQPDKTLTVEGGIADAKATGNAISSLREDKVGAYLTITSSEQLSSLADAEPNRIYLIGIDKPDTLPDFPSDNQWGTLITFNHLNDKNDGTLQIFSEGTKNDFYIRQSWNSEFGSWTKIFDARSDITNLWKYMMLYIAVWIGVNGTVSPPYDDINTFEIGSIVSGELKNVKNTVIDYGLVITLGDKNQTNYNKGVIQIAASIEDSFIRCNFGGWGEWINLKVDTSNFVKITDTYNPNISMFENIGVIGDSYSSGGMVINGEIVVKYGLSFPQVLKRQTGVDFVNYSFAGATCKTWLTNTSYGLSKLKSETKKQLYCICLGINDADGQETQPTGTIDDIKENYNENPNTFFGNMGKIISELQEYSPKSKILIFGIPKKQSQYVDYSVHIKQIANKFNLPYVDSMSNSFISSDDFQNNMSGGHPLAVGYSRMAVAIKELIEKALLNSYFSDYTGDV